MANIQIPTDVPVFIGVRLPTKTEDFSGVVFARLNKYWRTIGAWSGRPEQGFAAIEQIATLGFQPNVTIILDERTTAIKPIVEVLELRGAAVKVVSFKDTTFTVSRIVAYMEQRVIVDDNVFFNDERFRDAFVVGAAAIIDDGGTVIRFPGERRKQ